VIRPGRKNVQTNSENMWGSARALSFDANQPVMSASRRVRDGWSRDAQAASVPRWLTPAARDVECLLACFGNLTSRCSGEANHGDTQRRYQSAMGHTA
jgi:hypothetical protein